MVGNIIDYQKDYVGHLEKSKRQLAIDCNYVDSDEYDAFIAAIDCVIKDLNDRILKLMEAEKYNSDRHNTDYGTGLPSHK